MGLFSALRSFFAGRAGGGAGRRGAGGVDWGEVRRVYEEGEAPLKEIYARFGLSRRRLRQAYMDGGWRLRPQIAAPGPRQGKRPPAKPGQRPGQRRHDPRIVTRRLLRLAGERLARLEAAAAAEGAEPWPPTAEELKAMAELARALPPLLREDRLGGGAGGEAAEAGSSSREAAAAQAREEAERARQEELDAADDAYMRAELKRRLDILADNYEWHKEQGRGEEFLAQLRGCEERREAALDAWAEESGGGAEAG